MRDRARRAARAPRRTRPGCRSAPPWPSRRRRGRCRCSPGRPCRSPETARRRGRCTARPSRPRGAAPSTCAAYGASTVTATPETEPISVQATPARCSRRAAAGPRRPAAHGRESRAGRCSRACGRDGVPCGYGRGSGTGRYARRTHGVRNELGTITTDMPARLDRLPWARFHWLVVIGLGTVWILDGLEVTIVGSMSEALKPADTGLGLSSFDVGLAGAIYVAGACLGALVFGQLTDRFGRKKLFLITLVLYTIATVLTAFSPEPDVVLRLPVPDRRRHRRGVRGDQLRDRRADPGPLPRPDRRGDQRLVLDRRGRGRPAHHPAARPDPVDPAIGWRLAFGLGAVLALGVLLVRRHVPESPRWLFIHGREDEAERSSPTSRSGCRTRARAGGARPRPSPSGSGTRSGSPRSPGRSSPCTRGGPCCASPCSSARPSSTTRSSSPTATP